MYQKDPNFNIPNDVNFNISKLKLQDLTNSIKYLDCTKATGIDGLSPRILKLSAEIASSTLLDIINKFLQNGQFPDILKKSKTASHTQRRDKR